MKMPIDNPLFEMLAPILVVVVLVLIFVQWQWPLRRQHFSVLRRWFHNAAVAIPGFISARFLLVPIPFLVALWAERNQFGLFHWVPCPTPLAIFLGIFAWAAVVYARFYTGPPDAMTVFVIGKQWVWKAEHANGRREVDELHLEIAMLAEQP